jgi:transposase
VFTTGTGDTTNMKNPVVLAFTHQSQSSLDVCVDVSKSGLSWHHEGGSGIPGAAGMLAYTNAAVVAWLEQMQVAAKASCFAGVRVVCESTGGYHQRLLRLARDNGCRTALVSGEQVKQMQVVESNDTGKSDHKDPRTMMLLVRLGKTLTDRALDEEWAALRELDANYTALERDSTQAKNRIQMLLGQLFPDLSFKADWLFDGAAARAVLELFGFDPFTITAAGEATVRRRLRRKQVRPSTIARLWRDAQEAIKQPTPTLWRGVRVRQLRDAYEDLSCAQQRRARVRAEMIALLEQLQSRGKVKLRAQPDLIGAFLLARILAQTGPLGDFHSIEQLWRYAGMNLRPHQSGNHRGRERQAKRGRARLRHALNQAVLKLVVRGQLYGTYYHAKRAAGMPGPVAMTAVARKFLKLLFGLERSTAAYDPRRVFVCSSRHLSAAA